MRSIKCVLTVAALALALPGCGKKVPESWNDLGLPLDDMKVAHGTTPSDKDLYLVAPPEKVPQKLCESFRAVLEAKGYTANSDELMRVTPAKYGVSFTGATETVSIYCRSENGIHAVDLNRKGK